MHEAVPLCTRTSSCRGSLLKRDNFIFLSIAVIQEIHKLILEQKICMSVVFSPPVFPSQLNRMWAVSYLKVFHLRNPFQLIIHTRPFYAMDLCN